MNDRHARHVSSSPAVSPDDLTPRVRYETDVVPSTQAVHDARGGLRTVLHDLGMSPRLSNAALDIAHELLLNAHQHAAPPIRLSVEVGEHAVFIEVRDGSVEPARALPYRPGVSDHGLGLRLVRQLASEWGQEIGSEGKSVWARIS
jgi:two-component sensor histidine kinase